MADEEFKMPGGTPRLPVDMAPLPWTIEEIRRNNKPPPGPDYPGPGLRPGSEYFNSPEEQDAYELAQAARQPAPAAPPPAAKPHLHDLHGKEIVSENERILHKHREDAWRKQQAESKKYLKQEMDERAALPKNTGEGDIRAFDPNRWQGGVRNPFDTMPYGFADDPSKDEGFHRPGQNILPEDYPEAFPMQEYPEATGGHRIEKWKEHVPGERGDADPHDFRGVSYHAAPRRVILRIINRCIIS